MLFSERKFIAANQLADLALKNFGRRVEFQAEPLVAEHPDVCAKRRDVPRLGLNDELIEARLEVELGDHLRVVQLDHQVVDRRTHMARAAYGLVGGAAVANLNAHFAWRLLRHWNIC